MCPIALGALLLLALPACGADSIERVCPPECDGEAADAGVTAGDASPDPAPGFDGGAVSDGGPAAFEGEASYGRDACFNGVDDDLAHGSDCADPSCAEAAYCCAGETHAPCCLGAGSITAIDFGACGAAAPADCGDATSMGTATPELRDGALVPMGDATSDAGLEIGGVIDPTRDRVTLEARLAGPSEGCEGDGCVDAIVLGLADPPPSDALRVQPDVAVMVRGSRGDFALVVAGVVIAEWPLGTSEPRMYRLDLSPDGAVTLSVDGSPQGTASYLPRPDRRALLYGRNHGITGTEPPSRALDVRVSTRSCDVPGALRREIAPVAPWSDPAWSGIGPSAPSAARAPDGTRYLAFEVPAGIALLQEDVGTWTMADDLAAPTLTAPDGERYEDPELVVEGERLALYLTHERADGSRTIARADGAIGFGTTFGAPVDLTLPAVALESPSLVTFGSTVDGAARRLMAATERAGNSTRIVLLEASDAAGTIFEWAAGAPTLARPSGGLAFDGAEVGDPELYVDGGGLLRLYYAGRRGTRWAIGVRVSGNAVEWRDAGTDAALVGSGAGFDALGVRDPSILVEGEERVVFYTGMDGSRVAIGRAVGRTP